VYNPVAHEHPRDHHLAHAATAHDCSGCDESAILSRKTNPRYWELIDCFRRITGVPGVLNTSFTVKDEPIVCTPRDVLRCFYGTGLDALIMGDFVLEKAR